MSSHPQYGSIETDELLISALNANFDDSLLKKGKVKKSEHMVFDTNVQLTGWKFNEWDYGKPNRIQLPTQARGLFTTDSKIVIRGYDKFFNVNELPTTRWDYLLTNTVGPFELTLKENGCIIFISGLANGELVVCSKHSTGYRDDVKRNHAEYGFNKLKEQLDLLSIEHSRLGKALFEMNVTAVLELCDDDFEEHVLKYSRDESGLYLHGLNYNTPVFKTYAMTEVHKFADSFGFKKVDFFVEKDANSLKQFLEECAKTGTYNDREVEGFVVRCKLKGTGNDYFFKYKFEEPYLMYRQWREVTKLLISGKSVAELKITKHKYQTLKYIEFILPLLRSDEQLQKDYQDGHRVIELRNQYLDNLGKKGFEIAVDEDDDLSIARELSFLSIKNLSISEKKIKYVIIPVATIGCGKTTTALALNHLFPSWTHIQNDDIPSPVKDKLVKGALELLKNSPCCFVDRNNHQTRERQQIFSDFEKFTSQYEFSSEYQLKFICLNFIKDKYEIKDRLWYLTQNRVFERGDNHQSIKVEKSGREKIENIMKGFIGRFQKIDDSREPDSRFNLVIDLSLSGVDSSLENLNTVLQRIHEYYPDLIPEIPSKDMINKSFEYALNYKPSIEKIVKDQPIKRQKKQFKPTYFAISLRDPGSLLKKIEDLLLTSANEKLKVMYQSLKQLNRLQTEFHVTLTHIATLKTDKSVYSNYTKKYFSKEIDTMSKDENLKSIPLPFENCSVKLEKLCCTRQLMCIQVSLSLTVPHQESFDKFCSNKFPHITLGTIDDSIKPYMSNQILLDINEFLCGETDGYFELPWEEEVYFNGIEDLELNVCR